MNGISYELRPARRAFSTVGWAMCAIVLITTVLQILLSMIPQMIWGEDNWLNTSSWGVWLLSFVPIYAVAMPVGLLILRKLPAQAPQGSKLSAKEFWTLLPMCYCLMYAGNLIGTMLSAMLSFGNAENPLTDYAMDTNPLKIVVMVILAPLLEEYICRKQIIDRTRQYGEKIAIFLSALIFGLLHQNLFQFFYAFALGLAFGYIYVRTGRLRYTVLLHAIINFMGAVIAPWIMSLADLESLANIDITEMGRQTALLLAKKLPGLMVYMLYSQGLLALTVVGVILLIRKCKNLTWNEPETRLPPKTTFKTAYMNVGMILYMVLCTIAVILSLL